MIYELSTCFIFENRRLSNTCILKAREYGRAIIILAKDIGFYLIQCSSGEDSLIRLNIFYFCYYGLANSYPRFLCVLQLFDWWNRAEHWYTCTQLYRLTNRRRTNTTMTVSNSKKWLCKQIQSPPHLNGVQQFQVFLHWESCPLIDK